ncbi:uncharacterized protein LOC133815010 [Humulus lupulus]|uniref:uncharacterized protein LOC133815010 n=1 Tax=Humulus lupulus TaxID=3486 RepID=UPI002B415620|nr:uncharacterized protein LOC133815010 [Humulus lupulus]
MIPRFEEKGDLDYEFETEVATEQRHEEEHNTGEQGQEEETRDDKFELREEEYEGHVVDEDEDEEEEEYHCNDPREWWNCVVDDCEGNDGESDGFDYEDELQSLPSEDDGSGSSKRHREFNPKVHLEKVKFVLKVEFSSVELLREAIKTYFIQVDREYYFVFNNCKKLRVKCNGKGCPWVLYAYVQRDNMTFRINTLVDEHSYSLITTNTKFFEVSDWSFYRAKKEAMDMLEGSVRDQFAIVEDYCNQILATNPAVGVDGENSLFPIAYAVVEKENTETWKWFLGLVKEDLDIDDPSRFTLMSDRQKGLENAMKMLFQGLHIRYCVRHMHSNFKKEYPGLLLKQMLWAAARASTKAEFFKCMNAIKDVNEGAYNWLNAKSPTVWTRSHFNEVVKCDMVLNNMCESFNSAIVEARDKAIVTLLEKIRFWLMVRFCKKRESVDKWKDGISKRLWELLEKNKVIAKKCHATRASCTKFEVRQEREGKFTVDLMAQTCTCRRFELNGIPCAHAVASIWVRRLNVIDYVHDYYKKDAFVKAYKGVVEPMPSHDKWTLSINQILPPPQYKLPGRPKNSRKREVDEPPAGATKANRLGAKMHCSKCGGEGHNKSSCTSQINAQCLMVEQAKPAKKMGRPLAKNPK